MAAAEFEELGDGVGAGWAQRPARLHPVLPTSIRRCRAAGDTGAGRGARARRHVGTGDDGLAARVDPAVVRSVHRGRGTVAPRPRTRSANSATGSGWSRRSAPRVRSLIALGRTNDAERAIEETMSLGETLRRLRLPGDDRRRRGGAPRPRRAGGRDRRGGARQDRGDGHRRRPRSGSRLALGLCQTGRAEEALAMLLDARPDMPYARAVHAIAAALTGDFRVATRRRRCGVGRRRLDLPRSDLRRRRRGCCRVPHRRHGVGRTPSRSGRRRWRSRPVTASPARWSPMPPRRCSDTSTMPASSGWRPVGGG